MIINTLFYYTCIMNESRKCKKGDSICNNNHRVCFPHIKGWYMSMNSSFASPPHFCLQSTPKKSKDTM